MKLLTRVFLSKQFWISVWFLGVLNTCAAMVIWGAHDCPQARTLLCKVIK